MLMVSAYMIHVETAENIKGVNRCSTLTRMALYMTSRPVTNYVFFYFRRVAHCRLLLICV